MARFKRILLKLSGESLMGKQSYGIDPERRADYARQIKEVHEMGVRIGMVLVDSVAVRKVLTASRATRWACVPRSSTRLHSVRP